MEAQKQNSNHQTSGRTQALYKIRGTKVTSPYPTKLTPAETRLVFSLQRHFPPENIFADYYAPKVNFHTQYAANTTNFTLGACVKNLAGSEIIQIDTLAVNNQGIFIFESKDFSGWIYGNEKSKNWTQVLNYGREKYQFYNPIRQNALHIAAIQDFLHPSLPIYSIIVFGNQATLKTIPPNSSNTYLCVQSQLPHILSQCKNPHPLSTTHTTQIIQTLQSHCIIPDASIRQTHISDTKSALEKMTDYTK